MKPFIFGGLLLAILASLSLTQFPLFRQNIAKQQVQLTEQANPTPRSTGFSVEVPLPSSTPVPSNTPIPSNTPVLSNPPIQPDGATPTPISPLW